MRGNPSVYVQPWAEVDWQTPATPTSAEYGDVYWSRDRALAEKQHVFVDGNRLRERWQGLQGVQFTLCEAGFGFGINCLITANLWRRSNPRGAILNYVAFEKAPVRPAELDKLYAALRPQPGLDWGRLQQHAAQLTKHYPLPSPGDHLVWLDDDICLRLVIGDINECLQDNAGRVDAWYLDGFSPRLNPDAWQDGLFTNMARASRPGATFATYSVAGDVRRGLAAAGFTATRAPGFGNKAEMLRGSIAGTWRPAVLQRGKVGIIGAGLAGLHCAGALSRRGVDTTVLEAAQAPLTGASGVPRLAVSPRLAARPDRGSLFSLAAFQYAMQQGEGRTTGYCRLAVTARDRSRQARIADYFPPEFCAWLSAGDITARTGLKTGQPGLWLAAAGWCSPALQFAAPDPHRSLETGARVAHIESAPQGVQLVLAQGDRLEFDKVIIAAGAARFDQTAPLALVPVRGQSIAARLGGTRIEQVIAGALSIVPGDGNTVIAGATFDLDDNDDAIRAGDTDLLTKRLQQMTGDSVSVMACYAGVRCTTRDRMPVAGNLPHWPALAEHLRATTRAPFSDYDDRLYVCTGFGSHGATHAPLCAEHIARLITGEPNGLNEGLTQLLTPTRLPKKGDGGNIF